ncbi:hypothetical protein PIB30_065233 [Stylosanthes scabra]|uniref:Uncharacterized protein n=1 Tax=Stylosanthes scabra TaxID=79078 RepID=A0ABU6XKG8_9FABA|nr:hypothetical protein [Stylosanthes scabra]
MDGPSTSYNIYASEGYSTTCPPLFDVTQDIYMTISSCETAKDIWDKLNVTYEEDKKHKVYVSWENEDNSSIISDKDEVTNICLMENEDEVNDSNSTNNELQDAYDSLFEEFAKVAQEVSFIKKKNIAFQ